MVDRLLQEHHHRLDLLVDCAGLLPLVVCYQVKRPDQAIADFDTGNAADAASRHQIGQLQAGAAGKYVKLPFCLLCQGGNSQRCILDLQNPDIRMLAQKCAQAGCRKADSEIHRRILNPNRYVNAVSNAPKKPLQLDLGDILDRRRPWLDDFSADRFAHILHSETTSTDMPMDLALARSRKAGMVYITDDTEPNPYDEIAVYWAAVVYELGITLARVSEFGTGCAGTLAVPVLQPAAGSTPKTGETFDVILSSLPANNAAFLVLGISTIPV